MAKALSSVLNRLMEPGQARTVETGIDVIGDIAIVKLGETARAQGELVGKAVMSSMKNVKAVFDQEAGISGEFRLRRLRHLAGEKRTVTLHRENGLRLRVDVERCYFSPRLSTERLRIADLTRDGEKVLNMFAGVGPYSILIAKRRDAEVLSCELNDAAYALHLENNELNKVQERVRMVLGDAMDLPGLLRDERFDRIIMPHPSQSDRYLGAAQLLLRDGGWVHYYRHVSGEDVGEAEANVTRELESRLKRPFEMKSRKVRAVGPRFVELAVDIRPG